MKYALVLVLLVFSSVILRAGEEDPRFTPFVALLASPKDWNGKSIISSGFLVKRPKSAFLFQSSNDAKYNFIENAIIVEAGSSFETDFAKKLEQLDGQYIKIYGGFVAYGNSSPTRGMIKALAMVSGLGSFDSSIFKASQKEGELAP